MTDLHRSRVENPITAERRLRRTASRTAQLDHIEDIGINRLGENVEDDEVIQRKGKSPGRGGTYNHKGLTARQEHWCQLVATKPITEADAYRQAYDASNMRPGTIYGRCTHLKKIDKVRNRLDELRRMVERKVQRDESRIRDTVLGVLFDCVEDSKATWKDKLRAAELLGKVDNIGMWVARSEQTITDHRSSADLSKELQAKLARLIGADTIDVTPIHAQPVALALDNEPLSSTILEADIVQEFETIEQPATPGTPDPP